MCIILEIYNSIRFAEQWLLTYSVDKNNRAQIETFKRPI